MAEGTAGVAAGVPEVLFSSQPLRHGSPIPHTRHRDRDVAALLSAETSQHQWCSLAGPAPRCWGSTGPACAQVSDRVLQPVP